MVASFTRTLYLALQWFSEVLSCWIVLFLRYLVAGESRKRIEAPPTGLFQVTPAQPHAPPRTVVPNIRLGKTVPVKRLLNHGK